jgi:hypothetical protein
MVNWIRHKRREQGVDPKVVADSMGHDVRVNLNWVWSSAPHLKAVGLEWVTFQVMRWTHIEAVNALESVVRVN